MPEEFNKLDLLIKMIRMTETDNDGTALVAIRKANKLLAENGWDWERLLRGKVRIVADPFASGPQVRTEPARPATMRQSPPPPPPYVDPAVRASQERFARESAMRQAAADAARRLSEDARRAAAAQAAQAPRPKPCPLHFRKSKSGEWCIASYMDAPGMVGSLVTVEKSNGTKPQEVCGPFVEIDPSGYYLYKIAKATKWKNRFADKPNIDGVI